MIKNMWDKLFPKSNHSKSDIYLTAQLNDKIMPIDRGEVYEDFLDDFLKKKFYGEVTGEELYWRRTMKFDIVIWR